MNEKEQTINIASRIPIDLFADMCKEIETTGDTKSNFVKEAIEEKLVNDNKEFLDIEIKHLKGKLDILKSKVTQSKVKKKDLNKLSPAEIEFLKETKEILMREPTFTKGRINLYKNTFNKHYRISEQEFWELLERAGKMR